MAASASSLEKTKKALTKVGKVHMFVKRPSMTHTNNTIEVPEASPIRKTDPQPVRRT